MPKMPFLNDGKVEKLILDPDQSQNLIKRTLYEGLLPLKFHEHSPTIY